MARRKEPPTRRKAASRKSGGASAPAGRRKWLRRLVLLCVVAGVVVCALYAGWAAFYDLGQLKSMPQRTLVYDFRGKAFSRLAGEDRITAPIAQISPLFINALLAREDSRFYKHPGVDPIGIGRAVVRNLMHLSAREGASTLTQQLARNSFPLGGKNLHRKALEAFVALRIERNFTKAEILESYANRIYFGSGFWGVETASRAYFGKPSAKLTLSEAAVLAGLIRSPQRFSPFRNPEGALRERDTVLGRMAALGMVSEAQAEAAKNEPLHVNPERPPTAEQNYAVELVEQELGLIIDDDQLAQGGLRVYTAIDPDLQAAAQAALDEELAKIEARPGFPHPPRAAFEPGTSGGTPYLQGAVVVVDNATGGIRAVVGGRDYLQSRYNRAYLASRQVGSTFKPFVYGVAYERGAVTPRTGISDGPLRRGEIRLAPNWKPGNSDGTFRGVLPAEDGLVLSRNTMSVRVGDLAGLENVRRVGAQAGLGELPSLPAIYLGSFEATLKNLTAAYTVFPNGGVRRQSFVIDRVVNASGKTVYRSARIQTRVLHPRASAEVTSALRQALQRGTGAGSPFKGNGAGKTGTTNDYRDAWFIGYTPALTCGVWVGLDKPAQIMPRGYGATLALPVWSRVMAAAGPQEVRRAEPVRAERARPAQEDALPKRVFRSFQNFFGR